MKRALVAIAGLVALGAGIWIELRPEPPISDAPGFLLIVAGFAALVGAAAWRRAWALWLLGAWAGMVVADLVLAYWGNSAADWRAMATPAGVVEFVLHVALAPIELGLGLVVGYRDALGPVVASACLAAGLLGSLIVRRRWPRRWNAGEDAATS